MIREIQMEGGDGMRLGEDVSYFYLKCCKCELRHLVTVEWELVNGQKDAVILRYYSCEPSENGEK